ncbi:hypothetical protein BC834DRAFT_695378 [Gloeopeniophorella convolvens]|nr:hypothetical protein BC834DRAFT_695378 [Gloeopeniophorella convolvens]
MPTASFRIDPLDTARAAVAKDMDAISERIRSLKTRRNALLPVSSLPTEIISSIFFLLSVVDPVCVASKLGWIKVTHVCQAWRNVALDSPLLWRRIDGLIGRQWAYEMLGRAKDLPLALTIPYDFMRFVADPELLARTFELTLDAFLFSFSLGEILESPAPILESFWLSQTEGRLHSGELLLSTTLFDDNAPKLREIHLSNFVLPWTCLKSNSLTVLDVDTTSGKEEHLFPLSDLLVALKNCPQLEYLKLHNCLPYRDVPPRDGPAIVHLSRLQHLMLAGETACVAGLFQALCIPHTSTLSLSCKGSEFGSEYDPGNDPDVILPLVFKHVNGPGSAPFQSVSLELPIGCESEAYLEIVARRSSLPESGFDSASKFYNVHHSSDAELKLLFSRFPYYPLVPAFPKLMSNLPLADVHCLHVDAHNPRDWSSDSSWAEAFRCMSKVIH